MSPALLAALAAVTWTFDESFLKIVGATGLAVVVAVLVAVRAHHRRAMRPETDHAP